LNGSGMQVNRCRARCCAARSRASTTRRRPHDAPDFDDAHRDRHLHAHRDDPPGLIVIHAIRYVRPDHGPIHGPCLHDRDPNDAGPILRRDPNHGLDRDRNVHEIDYGVRCRRDLDRLVHGLPMTLGYRVAARRRHDFAVLGHVANCRCHRRDDAVTSLSQRGPAPRQPECDDHRSSCHRPSYKHLYSKRQDRGECRRQRCIRPSACMSRSFSNSTKA